MYCSISDVQKLLPPSITIGDLNLGTPSPGTQPAKRSSMTNAQVTYFITKAQDEINARLMAFYLCPLRRIKIFETAILNNLQKGSSVSIVVHDSNPFSVGDAVRIQNQDIMETANVTSVTNSTTFVIDTLTNSYSQADNSLVSVLEFPDPIPLVTARLAVAIGFDELFVADQAPNVSSYGNTQRLLALNALDAIIDGTIKLAGQEHTGRRFIRGSLFDAWKNPVKDPQFGREKPSAGGG